MVSSDPHARSFLGRSSLHFFLVWFLPELAVALSVSSRKMSFSTLIWISSRVLAGHFDNELLNKQSKDYCLGLQLFYDNISVLYRSRKS